LLSCVSPHFHLNAADGTELCALAAAYAAFRLHSGVAAPAHLDSPQWTGIFTHTAGDAPRLIYVGQFLRQHSVPPLILQGFVIEHTVAESLEERICNLILKLLTHTFGCLCALPAAGTVSSGALESFPDGIDNLLIGIELDFHVRHLFLDCGFIIPQDKVFFCDEVTLIKKSGAFFSTGFLRG